VVLVSAADQRALAPTEPLTYIAGFLPHGGPEKKSDSIFASNFDKLKRIVVTFWQTAPTWKM